MSHCFPVDRFTLPGDIPDASHPGWRDGGFSVLRQRQVLRQAQDERGFAGHPDPYDDRHLSHPAGRGWQAVSRQRLPGEPPLPSSVDAFAALLEEEDSPHAVFTRALQVRFLNRLATCGNVRASCAVAGVSPHTAYKARRRDGDFARLWDAALLIARPHSEAVLAARALDGVEVPIMFRGEVIGYRRHYDGRLLLAHLARLDRVAEEAAPAAREAAERFDELLALHAGAEPDAVLYEARAACADAFGRSDSDLPATREELIRHARGRALDELEEQQDEQAAIEAENAALEDAGEEAEARWDEWRETAFAAVDALVEEDEVPPQDGEGDRAEHGGGGSPEPLSSAGSPLHLRTASDGPPPRAGEDMVASEPCHPVTPCSGIPVPS